MSNRVEEKYQRSGKVRRDSHGEVCGEESPGFPLWTSSHGFHHISLTDSKCWRVSWIIIILICVSCLIATIIYYFYHVFSTAVFSQILIETSNNEEWPATIICEKQAFQQNKVSKVVSLGTSGASLLTWSLGPNLADPSKYDNTATENAKANLNNALARNEFSGNHQLLLETVAPNCTQLIFECKVGSRQFTGKECCEKIFNPKPFINQYGTCYTTVGAKETRYMNGSGEVNGLQVVTTHEDGSIFDSNVAHSNIFGASGVTYAVANKAVSVETALRTNGQSAQLVVWHAVKGIFKYGRYLYSEEISSLSGTINHIALTKSVIDNTELESSLIARKKCTLLGTRDSNKVDQDLLTGISSEFGYTQENCMTSRTEIIARNLFNCSYNPSSNSSTSDFPRCSPLQSVRHYRSFLDRDNTDTSSIKVVTMDEATNSKHEKECPQECIIDRYMVTSSNSPLSPGLSAEFQSKIGTTGQNINVVVLKFFMNSLEYQRIHNFPQHGLQFLAEVGGLMAFFLGISAISVLECFCYLCSRFTCCQWCCVSDDDLDEASEDLPPPKWRQEVKKNHDRRDDEFNNAPRKRPDLSRFDDPRY